jgi:transglutaminase-like putative cysteine protease
MKLRIEHITTFNYDHLISEAYTEMRLRPLDGNGQHTLSFSLHTEPQDEAHMYQDSFGNDVRHFSVIQPHQRLLVASYSEVMTSPHFVSDEGALSPLDEYDFLMPTSYAPLTAEIRAFSETFAQPAQPYETALAIMHGVYQRIKYEKGVTTVNTTAPEALQLGSGVCQDFAHLMLAACRSQKLLARYVSGYLFSNGYSTATHAWVDVYIPAKGWVSLDPTHDCEQTENYVRVAVGRDYSDVPPTRGVFVGNAREEMEVTVAVRSF